MLLGPEYGLVFVIKYHLLMRCLPQMAPTASHEYLCCLLRIPVLLPMSTCATSYEYLCYLLRVPAASTSSTSPLKEIPELVSLGRTKISSVMSLGSPWGHLRRNKNSFSESAKSGLFWMLLTAVLFIPSPVTQDILEAWRKQAELLCLDFQVLLSMTPKRCVE